VGRASIHRGEAHRGNRGLRWASRPGAAFDPPYQELLVHLLSRRAHCGRARPVPSSRSAAKRWTRAARHRGVVDAAGILAYGWFERCMAMGVIVAMAQPSCLRSRRSERSQGRAATIRSAAQSTGCHLRADERPSRWGEGMASGPFGVLEPLPIRSCPR
jgi:hypothetical protein